MVTGGLPPGADPTARTRPAPYREADMTSLTFPSDRFPAPPSVSLDIPDDWEPVSVPAVVLAARQAEANADFTPNVIVRVGTRPAMDQVADAMMELTANVQQRPQAVIGEARPVDLGGTTFHRVDVGWTEGSVGPVRQVHVFSSLPRDEAVQDFVHVTASYGGAGAEADSTVVEQVIASVRVSR
jgi:hypothetical protein